MHATVAERGQITVPKAVREELGLRPGDRLIITIEGGAFHARKQVEANPFGSFRGIIKTDKTTDELMAVVRPRDLTDEEWERP